MWRKNRMKFAKISPIAVSGVLLYGTLIHSQGSAKWQSTFALDKKNLGIQGANPYFNLTPGYQLSYTHKKDSEVVTVLNETRVIDGVTTRVVEDRESHDGNLAELTRDYYAIDSATNDVYY